MTGEEEKRRGRAHLVFEWEGKTEDIVPAEKGVKKRKKPKKRVDNAGWFC